MRKILLLLFIGMSWCCAAQDSRLFPTVADLSTFQGNNAWYKLGFWQKRTGDISPATPDYGTRLLPGPAGSHFEKLGSLLTPAELSGLQSTTFTTGVPGAAPRTIVSRLADELWVEDFREPGDTDADVWEKAIVAMQALKVPLRVSTREYVFTRTVVVRGDFWHVTGNNVNGLGTVIEGDIPGYGVISAATAPDLSYPTQTDPGPLRGCAFYFTTNIYYARTENITFHNFRFAMAYLDAQNSPAFINCTFRYGNVGVICYQGSQSYHYISCTTGSMAALHISSATCFPAGSPYAGKDNFYTDGLAVKNEGGYGSHNCSINEAFDRWFVTSILRPSTGSTTIAASGERYPYAEDSFYSVPSGRVVYVPMRNSRLIFAPQFRDVDVRGRTPRGFCLLNGTVVSLVISGQLGFEGMFDAQTDSTAYFTFGTAHNGLVDAPFSNLGYIEVTHPLLGFSGRGYTRNFAEYANRLHIVGGTTPVADSAPGEGVIRRTAVADAPYVVQPTDYIVAYTSLTAPRSVQLPEAARMPNRTVILKDESGRAGSSPLSLIGAIDGGAEKVLNTDYGTIRVYSNGTNWFTF